MAYVVLERVVKSLMISVKLLCKTEHMNVKEVKLTAKFGCLVNIRLPPFSAYTLDI